MRGHAIDVDLVLHHSLAAGLEQALGAERGFEHERPVGHARQPPQGGFGLRAADLLVGADEGDGAHGGLEAELRQHARHRPTARFLAERGGRNGGERLLVGQRSLVAAAGHSQRPHHARVLHELFDQRVTSTREADPRRRATSTPGSPVHVRAPAPIFGA